MLLHLFSLAQTTVPRPPAVPFVEPQQLADNLLDIAFIILGVCSLLVVVVQGVRYALSSGKSETTASVHKALITAVVGLAVSTSAWSLTNFALDKVIRADTFNPELSSAVNLFADIAGLIIIVGGFIALMMVILGGARYVFAAGDSKKVAGSTQDHYLCFDRLGNYGCRGSDNSPYFKQVLN